MNRAITVTRGLVGFTGLVQIVLGIVFWTGHALSWVNVHMAVGIVFVLALWTHAILCARAGAPAGLVATAVLWGLIVAVFGYTQVQLLPGPSHWIVGVLHLLVGMAGMGLAGALFVRTTAGPHGFAPHGPHATAGAKG